MNPFFVFMVLALMLVHSAAATPLQLAHELAEEQDWDACKIECHRVATLHPEHTIAAEALLAAVTTLQHPPAQHSSRMRRIGALPVRAMVTFYRSIIRPALGSRCVLRPSCSAYSLQAARERGWLSIPMTGDRLIREPTVVNMKEKPLGIFYGRPHYADPISDHIGGSK